MLCYAMLCYIETIGVGIDSKPVEKKTDQKMIDFLRSEDALKVFSNTQEIMAMANTYNITIDIFT